MQFQKKLKQFSQLVQQEINVISNGAKLTKNSSQKANSKSLRNQLYKVIKIYKVLQQISNNSNCSIYNWIHLRNFFVISIKAQIEKMNQQYPDCKQTYQEELDVILQFMNSFERQTLISRPPFTIQRIAQLTLNPSKYYKSTKKLLFAYEKVFFINKLVNINQPDQK